VKRLPLTDAFVDESIRGNRYLVACVMAEARHLPEVRPVIRALALHGRVHFNNESARQKRAVLAAIAELPVEAFVADARRRHGVTEFAARRACLTAVVDHLQERRVLRLVIESRDDDRDDVRHLLHVRRPEPRLVFEHRSARAEPMLWVADAVAWAYGAGGDWRRVAASIVSGGAELHP
jgi:hypothetical protein